MTKRRNLKAETRRPTRLTKQDRIKILQHCMPVLNRSCWALARRFNLPFTEIQNDVAAHMWAQSLKYKNKPIPVLQKLCYVSGRNYVQDLNRYYLRRQKSLMAIGDWITSNLTSQHIGTTAEHVEVMDDILDKATRLVGKSRAMVLLFAASFDWKTTKGPWYKQFIMMELGVTKETDVRMLIDQLRLMIEKTPGSKTRLAKLDSGVWTEVRLRTI